MIFNLLFLVSRKKSIDIQPSITKPLNLPSSSQPPGLKSPPSTLPSSKPSAVPTVVVNPVPVKELIDSISKVVSPPPMTQPPQINKIAGPSFASALAAVTAQSGSSSNNQATSAKISSKQFNSGVFEELETFFIKKFPTKGLEENVPKFLATSYQNLPDNYELERNRQYSPKQPYAMPSYYQSELPQILSNPSIFERFDLDTLFFIFYYQQKTYPQY